MVACVLNLLVPVLVIVAVELDRPLFDPGSVSHHSSSGSPPVLGIVGIVLSLVVCASLGCATLWLRRARRTTDATVA
jgi:hypothetical protein